MIYKRGMVLNKLIWYNILTNMNRFCVSPGFQNRGIGKKVLMKIESQIKNKGYDSIRLDVFTKNPYAQRLYRNHGYEVCGFAEWRKRTF